MRANDVHLGMRVRVAPGTVLAKALREKPRPEPGQMTAAGRTSRVVGSRADPPGNVRFALDGLPGLWRAEWLERADA